MIVAPKGYDSKGKTWKSVGITLYKLVLPSKGCV